MTKRILVIGDAMLDRYWSGSVERISPEAPVPVVHVTREEQRAGGAANVALNCAALGARVTALGIVGDDEHGRILDGLMDGVTSVFVQDTEMPTIVKLRVMGRSQQIVRTDFERPPSEASLTRLYAEYLDHVIAADAVVFSDYGKGSLSQIRPMIEAAIKLGLPTYIDPKGHDYTAYRGATLLKPNRDEMRQIAGYWNDETHLATKAGDLRRQLNLKYLLLTRAEDGMSLYSDRPVFSMPALVREVYDVTGAGDTVIAVMATLDGGIEERVQIANRAASIVCGHLGTAVVTRKELGL